MRTRLVETPEDRMAVAEEAGMGPVSIGSVLAGVLVAYGCFAVLLAVAAGVIAAMGVNSVDELGGTWQQQGIVAAGVVAFVQLVAYLGGGYVAGRMARRAGGLNGFLVFVLGLVIAVGVGTAVGAQAGTDAIVLRLRSVGAPTTWDEWMRISSAAGAGSLLAMLIGSVLGGRLGERWHGKLVTRAASATSASTSTVGARREVDLRDDGRVEDGDGDHFAHDDIVAGESSASSSTTLDEDRERQRVRR
jgi:hypothetical protein